MDLHAKATGKTLINTPSALNFPIENGKLAGWQVYIDTVATEKAFTATAKASGNPKPTSHGSGTAARTNALILSTPVQPRPRPDIDGDEIARTEAVLV
jgi:hypothetical protein